MALRELSSSLIRQAAKSSRALPSCIGRATSRFASTEATPPQKSPVEGITKTSTTPQGAKAISFNDFDDLADLESESSFAKPLNLSSSKISEYDPVKRAQGRKRQLPASRYQYRPPRYYRGPLHPHQPPPPSDPSSREYVPGPFSHTRLEHTYQSMIASDLMTMTYVHTPPGTIKTPKADRLRTWDDSSPYMKGRPKRGPRGPGEVLRLVEKDITWQNIPKIERVTVHSMIKGATDDSAYLHVAGLLLQSVTGVRPVVHRARHSVAQFGIRQSMPIALTCEMRGDIAYEFVDKVINLVLPKIKDWPGVAGSTGDSAGNLSFGFDREGVILFPEVEVNYDMYPPKMIPGFHVTVHTSATSDRHARLLLGAFGLPFYGKLVD
ncbi:ribosomal protein L5 domain-containing protein [Calycina marina]|uniref:Large ribosomal subunit protein uL5m n=1 Tax=Calycina marina TaxID=1763456 RepID=A0A9P7ZCK8_9HELO|nr:ribosomal protein L5 domain-containing protein [Calycina marina]